MRKLPLLFLFVLCAGMVMADTTPPAFLGTGTPSASTVLNGASAWVNPSLSGDLSGSLFGGATVDGLGGYPINVSTGPAGYLVFDQNALQWDTVYDLGPFYVTVVATSNISSLSGTPVIDGVTLSGGSTVLLTAQSTGSQNGLWNTNGGGAWKRVDPYYPTGGTPSNGFLVIVTQGTTYGRTLWMLTSGSNVIDTSTTTWAQIASGGGGGGSGTVTSFSSGNLSPLFSTSVANSTTTPSLSFSLSNAPAYSWFGNGSGSSGAPGYNTSAIPASIMPSPSSSTLGGVESYAAVTHQWINSISTSGVPSSSQPAFTDISGTASNAQVPAPTTTGLGGIEAASAATANQFVTYVDTSGVQHTAQPSFSNLTGTASASQLPAATTSAQGALPQLSGSSTQFLNGTGAWSTPSGGSSLPTDYISGLVLQYSSTTQIQVSTGSAYVPSASAVVTVSSALTASPTLGASTLYYVYLTSSGTLTVSSTAPTSYQGTAWKDSSGDRYLGCFLTNSSSQIVRFIRVGNAVYYLTSIPVSPFAVLNGGTATTATSVSCSAVVPATSQVMMGEITFTYGTTPTGAIGTSANVPTATTGNILLGPYTGAAMNAKFVADIPLVSQAFEYILGSSGEVWVYATGYKEDR